MSEKNRLGDGDEEASKVIWFRGYPRTLAAVQALLKGLSSDEIVVEGDLEEEEKIVFRSLPSPNHDLRSGRQK